MAVKVIHGMNHYNFAGGNGWTISASPRPTLTITSESGEIASFAAWDAVMIDGPTPSE